MVYIAAWARAYLLAVDREAQARDAPDAEHGADPCRQAVVYELAVGTRVALSGQTSWDVSLHLLSHVLVGLLLGCTTHGLEEHAIKRLLVAPALDDCFALRRDECPVVQLEEGAPKQVPELIVVLPLPHRSSLGDWWVDLTVLACPCDQLASRLLRRVHHRQNRRHRGRTGSVARGGGELLLGE